MNLFLGLLGVLLVSQECLSSSSFTFDDDGVLGVLTHKDTRKCANYKDVTENSQSLKVLHLEESCETKFKLRTTGVIKESGTTNYCLDVNEGSENKYVVQSECTDEGKFSLTGRGAIIIEGQSCIGVREDDDGTLRSDEDIGYCHSVQRTGGASTRVQSKNLFEFVAPGMSWYFEFPLRPISEVALNHCHRLQKRMCTEAEVCPNGPGKQSVIGVSGHKMIFADGMAFLYSDTCERVGSTSGQTSRQVNGLLCCPRREMPRPTKVPKNGYGYLLHISGKCVHLDGNSVELKGQCGGRTAAIEWGQDGTIKIDNKNLIYTTIDFTDSGESVMLGVPMNSNPGEATLRKIIKWQFRADNSVQDIRTYRCLVPEGTSEQQQQLNPPENHGLVMKLKCGVPTSSYIFLKLQGYLTHSSGKCVAVEGSKLVLVSECDDPEKVIKSDTLFYKNGFESTLIHTATGKCVRQPDQDNEALQLTTDCKEHGAMMRYKDGALIDESDKCVVPKEGTTPTELKLSSDCSDASSRFEFADARSTCQGDSCECLDGYERKGLSCFPINRCHSTTESNGGCDANAECIYTGPGSRMCLCPPGSKIDKDGVTCNECPDNNCYKECGIVDDAELIQAIRKKKNIVLRFGRIVTSDLASFIGRKAKTIRVYAQEIAISGNLQLRKDLKIAMFARSVTKQNGATIELSTDSSDRTAKVEIEDDKIFCKNEFPGSDVTPKVIQGASLNLYVGEWSAPFTCSGNYYSETTAEQAALQSKKNNKLALDADFLSMTLACAKVLSQERTFFHDKKILPESLPVQLTRYVLKQVNEAQKDQLTDEIRVVGMGAAEFLEELNTRAQGLYLVPYLSLKAHEKILVLLKDDAKMAIEQYEKYRTTSLSLNGRIAATKSMTNVMTAIVRRNDLDIDALERELDATISDRKQLQINFDEAKAGLVTAKDTFNDGVKEYRHKMIASAVFSVVGAISGIFTGTAGGVLGFAIELGSLAADVSKLTKAMFTIAVVMETVTNIVESSDEFKNFHYDILPYTEAGVDAYYSKTLPEQDGSKRLAVMVKEWDVFAYEADAYLTVGTVNDISGTSDYLAALKTVAVWGKAVHEKAITEQELQAKLIKLKALRLEQHDAQEHIYQSLEQNTGQSKFNGDFLIQMALQKQRLRNIMVDNLMSFCDSYFYNWLAECPITPLLSDNLYDLHEKINQALSSVIVSVENFAPYVPQDFEETIIIKDEEDRCNADKRRSLSKAHKGRSKRTISEKVIPLKDLYCPIATLKSASKTFLYRLDEEDKKIFKGYERVHVREFEIYLEGEDFQVPPSKQVSIYVSFSELMTENFRGIKYQFVAVPRKTLFTYEYQADGSTAITQPGKVAHRFDEYYDGIAALTTWAIQVPDEYNDGLQLSGVKQVRLKIKGTRVLRPDVEQPEGSEDATRTAPMGKRGNKGKGNNVKKNKGKKGKVKNMKKNDFGERVGKFRAGDKRAQNKGKMEKAN